MVTALNSVGKQAEARSASAEMSGLGEDGTAVAVTSVAPMNSRGVVSRVQRCEVGGGKRLRDQGRQRSV